MKTMRHKLKFKSWQYWPLALVGLAITIAVLALQIFNTSSIYENNLLARINAVWYDTRFQAFPPERDSGLPIVIIDLDEATQKREGRWPWDRSKVAELIYSLQSYGAAVIGFDMVFSEPSRNPITAILDKNVLSKPSSSELKALRNNFDGDKELAQALSDNTVLGYFFHADGNDSGSLPLPFLLMEDNSRIKGLIELPDYTANLELLTNNALASGFVVAVPDIDGIVRRMPLIMQHENGVYGSFSLEIVRLALGAPWIRLDTENYNNAQLVNGIQVGRHLRIPVDLTGSMLVPYKGKAKSYTTISATGVLHGDADVDLLEQLQGAIAIVGTSALGLSDLRTIPLQTAFPGVEVHANVIDTLLYSAVRNSEQLSSGQNANSINNLIPYKLSSRSPFYLQPDWVQGANAVLLLISGLVLSLLLPGKSPLNMLLRAFAWLAFISFTNIILWHWWHFSLPIALQLLLVIVLSGFNIAAGHFITSRQKRSIQNLFGEYVPAAHVAYMLDNPKRISLDGEQKEMTVLFADVRNFTSMSEKLNATELKSVLNRYLSAITEVIFQHNGTIDKYVGDLVMAFWNAPLTDEKHAANAVACALAMQKRMAELRIEFATENLPQFHTGIGINTGLMNVGDMGSTYRRAYTVMGDAVNLASRLESLTDYYKVPILVSDTTAVAATGFNYRIIDKAKVKGRNQPLNLYQPVTDGIDMIDTSDKAVKLYQQAEFVAAKQEFLRLHKIYPDDYIYELYLTRISAMSDDLNSDWDPVYVHESK